MIIVNVLFLIVFAILHLAARKDKKSILEDIDRKENKLYFLYPMASLLLTRTGLGKALIKKGKGLKAGCKRSGCSAHCPAGCHRADHSAYNADCSADRSAYNADCSADCHADGPAACPSNCTAAGYGGRNTGEAVYWYGRISLVLFILLLCNILSLFGGLNSLNSKGILSGSELIRPDKGKGSSKTVLEVTIKNSDQGYESKEVYKDQGSGSSGATVEEDLTAEISVTVNEKEYTQEELSSVMDRAVAYLDTAVLGANLSANRIEGRLNLISLIPGTKIKVRWVLKDPGLILSDGTINNEEADPEGSKTQATAVLSYGDRIREHVFFFTVFPRVKSKEELLTEELNREIERLDDETSTEDKMRLPERLGNYRLEYKEKREDTSIAITIMGLFAALLSWFIGEREHASRIKARNNQMLLDYPDIINKFILLVNAGMTIRQAWIRITGDYLNKKSKRAVKRYAYEEMLVTAHELNLGVNEAAAYEQFGKRTGILPYMKFSTLIVQNLKKGSKGLVELLNREALDAFEERKELAKRMGEEAQTKLLGPMLLMLLLILAIIMIPAFRTFNI